MILLSHSIAIKKNEKEQKTPLQQKKTKHERNRFYILCHLYLATLLLKKICATVSPLLGHFCIRFSREEDTATVSPIPATFHLLIRLLPCPGYLPYCVTYTWPVNFILPRKKTLLNCVTYTWPPLLLKKTCLLCHLYLAQFVQKKAGTISKKNQHPPGSIASYVILSLWNLIPKVF